MPNHKSDPPAPLDERAPVFLEGVIEDEALAMEIRREIEQGLEGAQLTGSLLAYQQMSRQTKLQETYILWRIRETKGYRRYSFIDEAGNRIGTKTWALYCSHTVGRSKSSVNEEILNLRGLGIEVFRTAEMAGIPMSKLTGIRLLTDASRDGVLEEIKNHRENHDKVKEIVRAAIEQHEFEKAEIQIRLEESQADSQAKDRVIEDKSKLIDLKNRELDEHKLIKDRETLTEEEKKQLLRKAVMDNAACVLAAIITYDNALYQLHQAGMSTASTPDITRAQLDGMFEQLEWTRENNGCGSHRQFYILPDYLQPPETETEGDQPAAASIPGANNVIPLGASGPDDQEA